MKGTVRAPTHGHSKKICRTCGDCRSDWASLADRACTRAPYECVSTFVHVVCSVSVTQSTVWCRYYNCALYMPPLYAAQSNRKHRERRHTQNECNKSGAAAWNQNTLSPMHIGHHSVVSKYCLDQCVCASTTTTRTLATGETFLGPFADRSTFCCRRRLRCTANEICGLYLNLCAR